MRISRTVFTAATQLLDHLMNDEQQQAHMHKWVTEEMKSQRVPERLSEDDEGTAEYKLYWQFTTEYHSKVLAAAILHLSLDHHADAVTT